MSVQKFQVGKNQIHPLGYLKIGMKEITMKVKRPKKPLYFYHKLSYNLFRFERVLFNFFAENLSLKNKNTFSIIENKKIKYVFLRISSFKVNKIMDNCSKYKQKKQIKKGGLIYYTIFKF